MKPHFYTRYVLVALTLTVAAGLTLTGAASAQEGVQIETNATDEPEPVEGRVGPIVIQDYELRGNTFVLTVKAEEPTAYALSDALAGTRSEGVTNVPVKQGTIRSGEQTLKLDVTLIEDAGAVTLSTPGAAVRIQSGSVGIGEELIAASTVRMLVLGTAAGAAGFTYRAVKRRREDETKDAERIL
jgi:hypothetical protein